MDQKGQAESAAINRYANLFDVASLPHTLHLQPSICASLLTPDNMLKSHHRHRPLDFSKKEIRLLSFDQDPWADVSLTLEVFELGQRSCPMYHALSYTWGSPYNNFRIKVNGQGTEVRANLHSFLLTANKSLAYADPKVYLWIDAICINQTNVAERNHQVQSMGDIYAEARSVIVWLGADDAVSDGIKCMRDNQPSGHHGFRPDSAYQAIAITNVTDEVKPFFTAPYWKRMWTVQEFLLARDVSFMTSRMTIWMDELISYINAAKTSESAKNELFELMKECPALRVRETRAEAENEDYKDNKTQILMNMLYRFRNLQCEDPRDTVYALLGIVGWKITRREKELEKSKIASDTFWHFNSTDDTPRFQADYSLSAMQLVQKLKVYGIPRSHLSDRLVEAALARNDDNGADEHALRKWLSYDFGVDADSPDSPELTKAETWIWD